MKIDKKSKMLKEAKEIQNSVHLLAEGNLDIVINANEYNVFKALAEDINYISAAFNTYINEISHILSHLSAGNMAVTFTNDIQYKGDFLPIKNALHKIKHSLGASFDEINNLSSDLDQLCTQVESGSMQIAQNAANQAGLINNLSDTVCLITEQTENNAANAKLASKVINEIKAETEVSCGYMDRMLESIKQVKESSNDISRIIDMISGIAWQTKLLAFNASIEAARAGSQGSGFSVVAREVRVLADRSAEAVNQTTELINNSIATAEDSADIANKTADSLISIQHSIDKASGLCTDIADVSAIQAAKLKDTSEIIIDISRSGQNNADYAEKNSFIVAKMAGVSSQMKRVMARFRLKDQAADKPDQKTVDAALLRQLSDKLRKAYAIDEIDHIFEQIAERHNIFECLYLISGDGYQLSHTVISPNISTVQEENFKPAMPGDYHGAKKYFREAIKNPDQWRTSHEYISTATGGLCKTVSCSFRDNKNNTKVICIDIICKF